MNLHRQIHETTIKTPYPIPLPVTVIAPGKFFVVIDPVVAGRGIIVRQMMLWTGGYSQIFRLGIQISTSWSEL